MKRLTTIITIVVFLTFLLAPLALAQEPAECQLDYTVQAGDWLSKIADKYLGDVLAYDLIVSATNARAADQYATIADPDLIEPGWVLCIPLAEVAGETDSQANGIELTGLIWRWDQTLLNNGDTLIPDKPDNYRLEFLPDGRLSVQADCNRGNGAYTIAGGSISIEILQMTLAACQTDSLDQEFLLNLNAAAIYFVAENHLFIDLLLDSGTMTFSPTKPASLSGASWLVRFYNNGKQALVSAVIGTELTATFGEDGSLAGSAGCNTYSATYEVVGENITIGPAATTRKLCAEPEGIMDQENQYLAALQMAASYRIEGEQLEMRTAKGAQAATFVAAVTGQITSQEQITLPEDALIQVQLQEVSLAGAPAKIIGEQIMLAAGQEVPIPFEVTYNPADIAPGNTYALTVRITAGQENLLFTNTRSYPVITQGNPSFGVEMIVQPG